jgi:hypothetical protein
VFCCELLDKRIGNLRDHDYSFKKVWNSHKANEIRNFIRDRKCFCTHECFYTTNLMFNPSFYPRLIIDALKFKKQKAAGGPLPNGASTPESIQKIIS